MKLIAKKFGCALLLAGLLLLIPGCGSAPDDNAFLEELQATEKVLNAEKVELTAEGTEHFRVQTYLIRYQSGECEVEAYLSVPDKCLKKSGEFPCIMYNRGGNRDYGANSPEFIAYLAESSGTIVAASQYRGTKGSTGKDQFGGDDVMDVIHLIDICESLSIVDMDNFHMLGASRGGMMTYLTIRQDSRVKKAVVLSGISDVFDICEARKDMKNTLNGLIGGFPENVPEKYEARSATYWADELLCPVMIIHSKLDETVPYSQAEEMAACLEAASMEYEFISYEDDVHGFHLEDFEIIMNWFGLK